MSTFEELLSRRALLAGMAKAGLACGYLGLFGGGLTACATQYPTSSAGLRTLADTHKKWFGAAIQSSGLQSTAHKQALVANVNMLVPENELKWRFVQPAENEFNFTGYNELAAFAKQRSMRMRGHTLVWHAGMPDWALQALTKGTRQDARRLMARHIEKVLSHAAGFVDDWDVVNEAVSGRGDREDDLRKNSAWLQALGPDYIPLAFELAHNASPGITLTYNDYGTEYATGDSIRRRRGMLRLLKQLRQDNIPVHQFGLQSHLGCHKPLGGEAFVTFLKQVRDLGFKIIITELDIDLSKTKGTDDKRLEIGARYTASYLNLVQRAQPLDTVLCWGLSTPYSFMTKRDPDTLGPLPLDEDMQPLPLWHTLKNTWLLHKERQGKV